MENIWPNKIEYSISTPSKALIFGTSVQVDFHIIPLLKGLTVGTISTQLVETHDFVLNPEAAQADQLSHKWTKVILDDSCTLDQLKKSQSLDGEVEGFAFSRILNLPKSLSKCLQDADTRGIKIKHKLKFKVQLHNPDRHLSEVYFPIFTVIDSHVLSLAFTYCVCMGYLLTTELRASTASCQPSCFDFHFSPSPYWRQ